MTNENYKFYSVLKNEDAMPFVGNNLLIVADGLGGSGSTVHNIEVLEDTALHDEIFQTAFFDFDWDKAWSLAGYLEDLVLPMVDGKPDTSALWGSRIAIARCVYALCCEDRFANADLSDERVRQQLVEFIAVGLEHTVKYFHLEKGRYDDQKLLPTTLAFIRYKTDTRGKVLAEVVWAGDSRCYALTMDGLKLLSIDDEDKSGSITNLFHVGGKKPTVLNYGSFVLDNPCVLMAVSDGVFDPFEPHDNFGVETALLGHIAGCNSYEELMKTLKEYYNKVHSDDATMAFSAVGFDSYADMQKAFAARGEYVASMWDKLCEANCALEVINQPEEDVRSYVEMRTADKFAAIIPIILTVGDGDIAFTDELKKAVAEAKARIAEEGKACKNQRLQIALDGLYTHLVQHPEENFNKILCAEWAACSNPFIKTAVEIALRDSETYAKSVAKRAGAATLETAKRHWRGVIAEREKFYWEKFNGLRSDGAVIEERVKMGRYLKIWNQIDVDFERGFRFLNVNDLEYSDKQLAREIEKFVIDNKQVFICAARIESEIQTAVTRYRYSLERLFALLRKDIAICAGLFNAETVEKFGLSVNNSNDGAAGVESNRISMLLLGYKELVVKSIVDSLAANYSATSAIDSVYNATRLNAFIEYYRLKANPNNAIGEFEKQLETLERLYESLLH